MELKPGYKQTEVGVIPEDWYLQKIQQIVSGNRVSSGIYKDKDLYGQGSQIIKLGDVFRSDFFDPDSAQRVKLNNDEINAYRVQTGDIIIALASVKLDGVGKVMLITKLTEETAYDHNVALIRLVGEFDQRYFFYLFKSNIIRKLVGSRATQVGTTFLKTSTILEFTLPIPPNKAEQTAIANALSDADALIQSLTRLIAKKRQIKQGAMQTLLNPYENGRLKAGWMVKSLGEICDVRDGTHDSPKYLDSGVKFVTSKNIVNNKLDLSEISYISQMDAYEINKRSKVDRGDILMSMIGTIGNAVLVGYELDFCIKNIALLKMKNVNTEFLIQYIELTQKV